MVCPAQHYEIGLKGSTLAYSAATRALSVGLRLSSLKKKNYYIIINMEARLLGLTREDVRVLAFQMAKRNGRPHRFNKVNQMAGKDWYYGFIERHPNLSLRKPKATSAARARVFNRVKVEGFFYALDCIFEKYNFDAGNIYNVDETAITTVQLLLLKNYISWTRRTDNRCYLYECTR